MNAKWYSKIDAEFDENGDEHKFIKKGYKGFAQGATVIIPKDTPAHERKALIDAKATELTLASEQRRHSAHLQTKVAKEVIKGAKKELSDNAKQINKKITAENMKSYIDFATKTTISNSIMPSVFETFNKTMAICAGDHTNNQHQIEKKNFISEPAHNHISEDKINIFFNNLRHGAPALHDVLPSDSKTAEEVDATPLAEIMAKIASATVPKTDIDTCDKCIKYWRPFDEDVMIKHTPSDVEFPMEITMDHVDGTFYIHNKEHFIFVMMTISIWSRHQQTK